jgi:hypothetical protein
MFSKIVKAIDTLKLAEENISRTNDNIKQKKDKFNKEWNKWGNTKSSLKKTP